MNRMNLEWMHGLLTSEEKASTQQEIDISAQK